MPGSEKHDLTRRFVGSPAFAALTASAAALVGLLGSVYQNEIVASFPLTLLGPYRGFSWRALVFWLSLFGLAGLVYLRQKADDAVRDTMVKTTEGAEQTSRRIEEFVQTLPPRAFQSKLASAVAVVHKAVSTASPRTAGDAVSDESLAVVARVILHSIATLAFVYDDQPLVDGQPSIYSANVMMFVPRERVTVDLTIAFLPVDFDRKQLRGVLELRTDLSCTSASLDGTDVDTSIPSLILPVPLLTERNGRAAALPGAPFALLTLQTAGYDDTATLGDWCREKGDFPPSVVEELHSYFVNGPGRAIRSFISMPLITPSGDAIAIANIHANRPGLLGPRLERRDTFQALLTPVVQDLTDVVAALFTRENAVNLPKG